MEKKITDETDLDEWDLLSDDGLVDVHQRELVERGEFITTSPRGVFDMNYFSCLSPPSLDEEIVKEVIKVGDQDMISSPHVSFKETEFVDMKMDSPKSGDKGVVSFIDTKEDSKEEQKEEKKSSEEGKGDDCVNMWGWKLTGIGALCSIGMAAVSVCIFILGRSHQKQQHRLQNQKLRFQIYTDDKRFKQVVHQASKLNQVVSSVRGGPLDRAQFTLGGYYVYDGL